MLSSGRARAFAFVCISVLAHTGLAATAEDWPEWRGKGRIGVWTDTASSTGPGRRSPCEVAHADQPGLRGPAVAGGRVFVTTHGA
jgi:hypothetical protein